MPGIAEVYSAGAMKQRRRGSEPSE
ncbi:MAG: hypothetical protein RLZZ127_2047, partial [Planctomycetota bacterium]